MIQITKEEAKILGLKLSKDAFDLMSSSNWNPPYFLREIIAAKDRIEAAKEKIDRALILLGEADFDNPSQNLK